MIQTIAYIKGRFVTGATPTQADFADLVDTVVAVAQTQKVTYLIKDTPAGSGQKPSGNTLTDAIFINRNILNMVRNNLPLQWDAYGVTYNSDTGTFDFTAIGGLQDGDNLTIYYY